MKKNVAKSESKRIYLDYAGLTPVSDAVVKEMAKYMGIKGMKYSNPSSIHSDGVNAKNALSVAREDIAKVISSHPDEIYFTGSGTESNNLAIFGVSEGAVKNGISYKEQKIIVSGIEHSSILESVKILESRGVKVIYLPVNNLAQIDIKELKKSLDKNTLLVSIMYVNNETGSVQPLRDAVKVVRDFNKENGTKILFHTDASQAPVYFELNMQKMGLDLMTLDSHKVYGPRGVGMIYIKRGVQVEPIIHGGGQEKGSQEKGIRSGTENIPGICGFSFALKSAYQDLKKGENMKSKANLKNEFSRISEIRDEFEKKVLEIYPDAVILCSEKNNNGADTRSPHISMISFPEIDGEYLALCLDAEGVSVSTKSSCLKDIGDSYVLKASGVSEQIRKGAIRFSFGKYFKKSDINTVLKKLIKCYNIQHGTSK